MADGISVEFCGGPANGEQKRIPAGTGMITISEEDTEPIQESVYRRRRINGLGPRLSNGFIPFDFDGE